MTAAGQQSRMARISRIPHRLLSWGMPMGPLTLLRARGRRSGLPRTVPVALLRDRGSEWLVSPFGDTNWVHNVRVEGRAELGRGRRFRRVRLAEIDDDRKLDVLLRYRRRYGLVPFVRNAFTATPRMGPHAFKQDADHQPVFRIDPDG